MIAYDLKTPSASGTCKAVHLPTAAANNEIIQRSGKGSHSSLQRAKRLLCPAAVCPFLMWRLAGNVMLLKS